MTEAGSRMWGVNREPWKCRPAHAWHTVIWSSCKAPGRYGSWRRKSSVRCYIRLKCCWYRRYVEHQGSWEVSFSRLIRHVWNSQSLNSKKKKGIFIFLKSRPLNTTMLLSECCGGSVLVQLSRTLQASGTLLWLILASEILHWKTQVISCHFGNLVPLDPHENHFYLHNQIYDSRRPSVWLLEKELSKFWLDF